MHFQSERLIAFSAANKLFREHMYGVGPDGKFAYLCRLHDAFGTVGVPSHNCLGCNFADLSDAFSEVLADLHGYTNILSPCSSFLLWLYLFVERYEQIMNIVAVPNGYRQRHFRSFQRIRRWANFVKHPKAFLYCHHPLYLHGGECGDDGLEVQSPTVHIDQKFIDKYYASPEHNIELSRVLANATDVIVVFPDPELLMEQFIADTKEFVRMIETNEVYREELSTMTTADGYFQIVPIHENNDDAVQKPLT